MTTITITAIIFSWTHIPSEVLQPFIGHILAIIITCSFISLIFPYFFPQQSLNFFPEPHGHASFGAGVFFDPQQLAIFFHLLLCFFRQ